MVSQGRDNLFCILTHGLAGRTDQPFLLLPNGRSVTFGRLLERCGPDHRLVGAL